jgi:hypothetical protein
MSHPIIASKAEATNANPRRNSFRDLGSAREAKLFLVIQNITNL